MWFDVDILVSDGAKAQSPSYWLPCCMLFSKLCCISSDESIFQFDGFHLHFISLFLEKYHLYIILLADLSLLFLFPPHVVGLGFDFLSAPGTFLILSQSNLPSMTVHLSL